MSDGNWEDKKVSWIGQVESLTDTIMSWATERRWLVDRQMKTIHEDQLGTYSVPELVIRSPQGNILIEPVGRDIIGAEGRVDICSFPSFNRMLLIKIKDSWQVKTDSKIDWPTPWNKETFYGIVKALTAD